MFTNVSQAVYRRIASLMFCFFAIVCFVMPSVVLAQTTVNDPFQLQNSDFANTINLGKFDLVVVIANGIQIFLGVLGIIAVLIFLYAGWLWMTSQGDEEKIGLAKKIMVNAVIGLSIILASYAITEFIIRKLTDATGFTPSDSCSDLTYASNHSSECSSNPPPEYCTVYPTAEICLGDVFVVKSITPVTTETGMNNVVIHVIFSKQVVTAANDVVRIKKGNVDITEDFTFTWDASNRLLEATYTPGAGILNADVYTVAVQDTIRSVDDEEVRVDHNGNTYPLEAVFRMSTAGFLDTVAPVLGNVKINGSSGIRHIVKRNSSALVESNISDDHGVSFGKVALRQLSETIFKDVSFDGPTVQRGSDALPANPFVYASSLTFARNMSVPVAYAARVSAVDIGNNTATPYDTTVIVVGESCDGTTGGSIDQNNPDNTCLAEPGGSCDADWQCVSGVCDESAGVCLPYPLIVSVDPWKGAEGNLMTVIGKYFGDTAGKVYFGYDANNDTIISNAEWIEALPPSAECPEADMWNDNMAIVKVPADAVIPQGSSSTIRIVRGDASHYEDTTVDNRGPKAGDVDFPGYFKKNTDRYPGLCSVLTVASSTSYALPETDVLARGLGFGTTRGQITFGGQQGTRISGWSNFSAQTRIPSNLRPGLVSARVIDGNGKESNAVPFRILSASQNTLPVIEAIDPPTTTKQSFITILGDRFGTDDGAVWVSPNQADIAKCSVASGRPASCIRLDYGGYDFCAENYWGQKQIFLYVPDSLVVGRYFVLVQTTSGSQTSGNDFFEVVAGAPRPSICALKPSSGPAPLPNGHAGIDVLGINLFTSGVPIANNSTTVYFWRNGASSTDPIGTWLSSLPVSDTASTISATKSSGTTIHTVLPVTQSGETVQSGPIVVYAKGAGASVNLVQNGDFEVAGTSTPWVLVPTEQQSMGMYAKTVADVDAVHKTAGMLWVGSYYAPSSPGAAMMTQEISGLTVGVEHSLHLSAILQNGTKNDLIVAVGIPNGTTFVQKNISISDEWGEYVVSFVPTQTTSTVLFGVLKDINPDTNNRKSEMVYIDNVSVSKSSFVASNRATYTVNDCRTDSTNSTTMKNSGYQCCTEGPEAGVWKSDTMACKGQTRDAGYVWRFTTGKLSNRPTVVEQCVENGDIPSPVPSTLYADGQHACINQVISVRFDVDANTTTMIPGASASNSAENPSNVVLFACGSDDVFNGTKCKVDSHTLKPDLEGKVLTIYDAGIDMLERDMWYRVALSKDIQATSQVSELGVTQNKLVNIRPTRPCTQGGKEYAYCFEFRTSKVGEQCVLVSAGITPRTQESKILGRVSDVMGRAILFHVFGRGSQVCSVLNVDNLNWSWSDQNGSVVKSIPETTPKSKAQADALGLTTQVGSDIYATFATSTRIAVPSMSSDVLLDFEPLNDNGSIAKRCYREGASFTCDINVDSLVTNNAHSGTGALRYTQQIPGEWDYLLQYQNQTKIQDPNNRSISMSFWLYPSVAVDPQSNSESIQLLRVQSGTSVNTQTYQIGISLAKSNRVILYQKVNDITNILSGSIFSSSALADRQWSHVTAVISRDSTIPTAIYINGVKKSTTTAALPVLTEPLVGTATPTIYIGGTMLSGEDRQVDIDDVRLSYRALSPSEVSTVFFGGSPIQTVSMTATSTIIVDPGKPKVVDYWPRCSEACVNAGLGAMFNRPMVTSTYVNNYTIRQCTDGELCATSTTVGSNIITLDTQQSDITRIVFNTQGTNTFATNTWYVVSLNAGIRAYAGSDTLLGDTLEPFSWKFRTKSDGTLCTLAAARVQPLSIVVNVVQQKTLYSANALSAPDSCSPQGQVLNPWSFNWSWSSASTNVATVSNIKSGGTYYPWCTNACLPSGSAIKFTTSSADAVIIPPMCGDGVVGAGEDCDIARTGENPGGNCSFRCLRVGNTASTCGDGFVSSTLGEECDGGGRKVGIEYLGTDFCSAECTNKGSTQNRSVGVAGAICGNGIVETAQGEECDIADLVTKTGCTTQCLRSGTELSRKWCDSGSFSTSTVSSTSVVACKAALSVCGNGAIESGEQCERTSGTSLPSYCSSSCLIVGSVCGTQSLYQCAAGTPGCTSNCTFAGASLTYATPSVCGDLDASTGKDLSCQIPNVVDGVVATKKGLPVQIVTAIGLGTVVSKTGQFQSSTISAVAQSTGAPAGEGDYYFQCGYTEYDLPQQTQSGGSRYNNCVDMTNGVAIGVGINSCCYPRSTRVSQYPEQGAINVCRNTYIEAQMSGYIDQNTLSNNVRVVSYHSNPLGGVASCPNGLEDVTDKYTDDGIFTIAKNTLAPLPADANVLERLWYRVRTFVARLFGESANAALTSGKLCAGIPITGSVTIVGDGTYANTTSTIRLQIGAALLPNTPYYVTLNGGKNGIKDVSGVGIKHPTQAALSDAWRFTTGNQICKLDAVSVTPSSALFQSAGSRRIAAAGGQTVSSTFVALGNTVGGAPIVPLPAVYDYDWMWVPGGNPLFDIPVAGSEQAGTSTVDIASKNIEGSLYASAVAIVTADSDTSSESHINKTFIGKTLLTSIFCNNIWPPVSGNNTWKPFEDIDFHVKSFYCADAGALGVTTDDLPVLSILPFAKATTQTVNNNTGQCTYTADLRGWQDMRASTQLINGVRIASIVDTDVVPSPHACVSSGDCDVVPVSQIVATKSGLVSGDPDPQLCFPKYKACDNDHNRMCVDDGDCDNSVCADLGDENNKNGRCLVGLSVGHGCTYDTDCNSAVSTAQCSVGTHTINVPGAITDDDVVRRYLLVSDKNDDAMGIQILKNQNGLSVSDWYRQRFGASALQRVMIDGYEALTNGDTFYIGAYNKVTTTPSTPSTPTLYNNIYVVTVSQGAQANTRLVLDQLIRNLKFNTNINDESYCSLASANPATNARSCSTDFDCRDVGGVAVAGFSGVCGNDRTKFFNDLKRLQDIGAFQRAVDQYKAAHSGAVPAIAAGTYYPGYTNSMWPSWQGALGASDALSAALPRDPVNRWSQCGVDGINNQTCWDQVSATYACPAFMQIYEYKQNSTSTYMLHAGFEYLDDTIKNASGTTFINGFINPALVTSTPWCAGEVRSPFGGKCGDGIIQPMGANSAITNDDEVCEIGQTTVSTTALGLQSQQCNSSCNGWVNVGSVQLVKKCGNGIVESPTTVSCTSGSSVSEVCNEVCDDGEVLNGTYGHCNTSCSGKFAEYCGDGKLTAGKEYCDTVTSTASGVGVCTRSSVKPQVFVMMSRNSDVGSTSNLPPALWASVVSSMSTVFSASLLPQIQLGVAGFSNNTSDCGNPVPKVTMGIQTSVSWGFATYGFTSDYHALKYILDNVDTIFASSVDIPKHVILLVSGTPLCISGASSNELQSMAVDIATLLRQKGIQVHVVAVDGGVGSTVGSYRNLLASAGGSRSSLTWNSASSSALFDSMLSCSPYGTESNSCAYDCQSAGSYCGDGVADLQFGEQCDDANTVDTDACDNACKKVVNPLAPTRDPGRHYCGDAVRDWDDKNGNDVKDVGENWVESCDTGATQLGNRPLPGSIPYGEVRTYCSVDCQDILTVDSAARCGNGKRDYTDTDNDNVIDPGEWLERCDTIVSNGHVTTGYTSNGSVLDVGVCTEKGARTCENSCQTYVDSCVSCVASTTPSVAGFAHPRISVINPMIADAMGEPGLLWGSSLNVILQKRNTSNPTLLNTINGQINFDLLLSPFVSSTARNNFMSPNILASGIESSNARLQASTQCTEYVIDISGNDGTNNIAANNDVFSYPVHGELGNIDNEYVFSPAVPTNTFRVVVRWTDKENSSVQFTLNAYSELFGASMDYLGTSICDEIGTNPILHTQNGFPLPRGYTGEDRTDGYWYPVECPWSPVADSNLSVIATHPIVGLSKTFAQSITIDTDHMVTSGLYASSKRDTTSSIAVYVSAIRATAETSIADFKNNNVEVDVYTPHAGQNPTYSIYAPTVTLSIKNAERGSNPDAPYWHVFNLVKNTSGVYEIKYPTSTATSGVFATDLEQIRKQTPNDSCFGLQSCTPLPLP